MLSFAPHHRSNDALSHEFSSKATAVNLCPKKYTVKSVPKPSTHRVQFSGDHLDAAVVVPNLISQTLTDQELQALVSAHWNEFIIQEILLSQGEGSGVIEREADEVNQLQLALHKLERAKLEVAYYSNAISKVANTMRIARRSRSGLGPGRSSDRANHNQDASAGGT